MTHIDDNDDKFSNSNLGISSSFKMSLTQSKTRSSPRIESVSVSSKLVNKFEVKVSKCSSPSSKILTQTCDESDDNMSREATHHSNSGVIKITPSLKSINRSGGLNNSKFKLIHRKGKTNGKNEIKSQDIRKFRVSQSSADPSQEEGGRSESERIIICAGESSQTKITTNINSDPCYKMTPAPHDHS